MTTNLKTELETTSKTLYKHLTKGSAPNYGHKPLQNHKKEWYSCNKCYRIKGNLSIPFVTN